MNSDELIGKEEFWIFVVKYFVCVDGHERWEIETALDELKTHLRGSKIILRSKTPDLVRKEFYGLMMAHFSVRGLMHGAVLKVDEDADSLSFLHAVRVVRRKIASFAAIPPSCQECIS